MMSIFLLCEQEWSDNEPNHTRPNKSMVTSVWFIILFYTFIYLVLARIIVKSLGLLLILFAFVGNKLNRKSTAKRSKRLPKRKK